MQITIPPYDVFDYLKFGICKGIRREDRYLEVELELYFSELEEISSFKNLFLVLKNNTYLSFEPYASEVSVIMQPDAIAHLNLLIFDTIKIGPLSPGLNCYVLQDQEKINATSGRLTLDGEVESILDTDKKKVETYQLKETLTTFNQFLIGNKQLKNFQKQLNSLVKESLIPLAMKFGFKQEGKFFYKNTKYSCVAFEIKTGRWNSDLGLHFSIPFYLFGGLYEPDFKVQKLSDLFNIRSIALYNHNIGPISGNQGLPYTINGRISGQNLHKMLSNNVADILIATADFNTPNDVVHFIERVYENHPEKKDTINLALYYTILGKLDEANRFLEESDIDNNEWIKLKSVYNLSSD